MEVAISQKWFDCHKTKRKHTDWTLVLICDHRVWPWPWHWPWIFKVKAGICYISAKNSPKDRCKDLPDNDQGDLRCRRAVDSSSFICWRSPNNLLMLFWLACYCLFWLWRCIYRFHYHNHHHRYYFCCHCYHCYHHDHHDHHHHYFHYYHHHCDQWHMFVNLKKTQIMVLNKIYLTSCNMLKCSLNGLQIEETDYYIYLGVKFTDSNGCFNRHIEMKHASALRVMFSTWNQARHAAGPFIIHVVINYENCY